MRYWFDTEFIEAQDHLQLISIGLVSEDGRELYRESADVNWSKANPWVLANVKPLLSGKTDSRRAIRDAVEAFVGDDESPEFWGYCSAYDWVLMCWLFGTMMELPYSFPYFCNDLAQLKRTIEGEIIPSPDGAHNALTDARWTRDAWAALVNRNPPV